jgi:hypothetical protein
MVETAQSNSAEPRRPKKDRPQCLSQDHQGRSPRAARRAARPGGKRFGGRAAMGVSRSTARTWMAERAAMAEPPAAMAESPPPRPPPVAVAMVNPTHDEPFQAKPPLRDEQPRQEAPVAATMVDERPAGEGAPGAMAVPVDTSSTAMAVTERPAWRPIVLSLDAHPPAHPDAQRAHPAHLALRRALGSITPSSATIAYLVAYGLFVVGLTINVTLAISYAPQSSWWHATIMALEGVAIEVLAFRSPS